MTKRLTKIEGGFLAASIAVIIVYLYTLASHLLNIPLTDDYYDNLYFLHAYTHAETIKEKIHLLFWQYDEKKFILNRLIYLAYYYLTGGTNFYYLSLIGNAFLIGFVLLLYKLYPENKKSYGSLLVICLCVFNLSHHQSAFWTMSSLSNYSAMIFALCCFYWLTKPQWYFFLASGVLSWFATFSMANGLLILPLGFLCIGLHHRRPFQITKLCFWGISSFACAYFYLQGHEQYNMDNLIYANTGREPPGLWLKLSIASQSGFALLGAVPFNTNETVGPGMALGLLIFIALGTLVIRYRYFYNQQHTHIFVFLLFCLASIAVIALYRAPTYGIAQASYTSRYKNISSVILALTLLLWINGTPDNKKFRVKISAITLSCVVFVFSYFKYLPEIEEWHNIKQNDMSRWILRGDQASLGLSAWYSLSHEIMSESVRNHIYDPLSDHTGPFLVRKINLLNDCPSAYDQADKVFVGLTSEAAAVGAKITYRQPPKKITHIYLCSNTKNYELVLGDNHLMDDKTQKMKVIFNKTNLAPDVYSVVLKDEDNHYLSGRELLTIQPYQPVYNCNEHMFDTTPFRKPMVSVVCAEYRKTHPSS